MYNISVLKPFGIWKLNLKIYWHPQRTIVYIDSVQSLSRVQLLWPHRLQHARLPCPLSPGVCPNSCPLSRWYPPTISSSASRFSFCLQSFPASGSFPMSQLAASDGRSIRASASVLPMNIQVWFLLGLNGLISLQSKGVSRDFSRTTIQKHKFFGVQSSLWSNSHIHTWQMEKP